MTQIEHTLVAIIVIQLLWHLFIKKHMMTREDYRFWKNVWRGIF